MEDKFNLVEELLKITLFGTEWVLWLLILLSVLSLFVVIERFIFFMRIRLNFTIFSHDYIEYLIAGKTEEAEKLCRDHLSFESEMALQGFKNKAKGIQAMEESMAAYLVGSRQKLDKGLVILGTLGNNAPFIGLFGTVLGIIQAFHDLAQNPDGGTSVVMSGISEALIATAVGLLVAIPAVIFYNAFQRKVKQHMSNAQALLKLTVTHFAQTKEG